MTELDPKADGSAAMFDRIAHRYDALNRVLSLGLDRRWRRRLVDALALGGRGRVLDLASGTGDVAITIAGAHAGATVVGLDPSAGMLSIARDKAGWAGLGDRLRFQEGRAEQLPFEDGAFDATCIAFGIRNVPDRPRALAEMRRVTRPGGRVAVLELSEPGRGVLGAAARLYVHHLVPRVGALFSGAPEYRYLQRSIAAFPRPEEFQAMMRSAGLEVRAVHRLGFGVAHLFVAEPAPGSAITAPAV